MPILTRSHLIDRPIADLFAVVSDWTTLPDWDPAVGSVRQITGGEPVLGTIYQVHMNWLGDKLMTASALEHDRLVELSPSSRLYRGGHRITLAIEGAAIRAEHLLTLNPWGPLRVLSLPTALIARRVLANSCTRLQAYCEQR